MRTCKLCDKPLSRIWLGAGEDFCSREHRNQYRLRAGMDRLLEANKVASLMRRRESPKALSPFRDLDETGIPRRGFFDPQIARLADAPLLPGVWQRSGATRPLLVAAETGFLDGSAARAPQTVRARHAAEAPRLLPRTSPVIHSHRTRQSVHIVAAGAVPCRGRSRGALADGVGLARDSAIRWNGTPGPHLDPRRVTPAYFHAFSHPRGCRPANPAPPPGYSLRVSLGAGFRIQSTRLRGLKFEPPAPQVPRERHEMPVENQPPAGQPSPRVARAAAFAVKAPGIRALEWAELRTRMEWPGLLPPCPQEDREGPVAGPLPFRGPKLELRWHGEMRAVPVAAVPPPIRHGGRDRARLRLHLARPAGDPPAPRSAAVPIGCVADGVDSRPGAPPESRSSFEERFDAGWKNWTGGYASWTVDAAGARTGSLALFTPSLEWRDYELEFFTRIENHSLTWVYRAAGLNDYYMAALTALPGKGYAFTRRTVWRGKPGAAYTAPLSILPNPKSAYLIRMRIAGNQFSLSIDGQLIESWTDSRFSSGGVGFIGAPEDRARIYWVRFYPGPAKEFPRT